MRAVSISIDLPVRVHPPPRSINNRSVARETQRFIEGVTEVPESVLGGGHMSLARALDVFAEFGISEHKVGSCHVD